MSQAPASAGGKKSSGTPSRKLPFPFGSALFKAVNVKWSLTLLAVTFGLIWYLQEQEKSLIQTTQIVQVDRVIDGDTFVGTIVPSAGALLVGKSFRFRLRIVDAPERDQPFGEEATLALQDLLVSPANDREVVCRIWEKDTWGRFIVDAFTRDNIEKSVTPVQRELVAAGMAWTFGGLSKDRGLSQLEEQARSAKRGLWAQENPVAPWKHRRAGRQGGGGNHRHRSHHTEQDQKPASLREQHESAKYRNLNRQKNTHTTKREHHNKAK